MGLPIYFLHEKLIVLLQNRSMPLGLANGKMGHCIYFYYLNSFYNDHQYRKIADKLVDDIFNNITTVNTIDIKSGLAGIGLGINHLIKNNYVKGDVNIVLNDVDDIIFKNLSYPKYLKKTDSLSLIHILCYLCLRFKDQKQGSENEYLYRELIIQTVNNLYEHLSPNFQIEPLSYNTDYILPQFLFLLSKIYQLDFYNYRLIKIIEEISYKVLSTFPTLNANRLYLLWAMDALNKLIKDERWRDHIVLLKEQTNIEHIFNYELRNKNIYFQDGITSIYYLINSLADYFDKRQLEMIKLQTINKIRSSEIWNLLESNPQYFNEHNGLYDGLTGIFLLLHKLQLKNI